MKAKAFNILENLFYMGVVFVMLIFYSNKVMVPVLIAAIQQETTKIEQHIDQKFKKVDNVNATTTPSATSILSKNGDCISVELLSDREKRKLKKAGHIN